MRTAQPHLFEALVWRLAQRISGARPDGHRGLARGAGEIFADVAPLARHPDPRRLDLRRSLTDPFGEVFVRRFETRTDLTLHLLLDASASLATGAATDRQETAALLASGFAQAARRGGDLFALDVGCGGRRALEIPPGRSLSAPEEIFARLQALAPQGEGLEALARLAEALPHERILVALISDFEQAPEELEALLSALRPRPLLPIWLRDSGLENPPGGFGLADLRDPETGRRRALLTTKAWAAAQSRTSAKRRAALKRVFERHGLRPVEILDGISIGDLSAALEEAPL